MPYQSNEAKQQMLYECRRNYTNYRSELNQIEEFSRSYSSKEAINWYTRDCFLYRTLNRALRTEDILVLYTYRFFIVDTQVEHSGHRIPHDPAGKMRESHRIP